MVQKHAIFKNFSEYSFKIVILITSCFIFMANSPGQVWGANIYIDPTYSGTELGTFDNPYNSWKDFTINTGNDYRQKCGTTYTGTLSITYSGLGGNNIIIGAYNADGSHEDGGNEAFGVLCSGGSAKPIIDDPNNTGSAVAIAASYIELNSIHVRGGDTTIFSDGDYIIIQYCEVSGGRGGIRVGLISSSKYIYVGFNYVHTDWGHDKVLDDLDGIQFGANTNNSLMEYNTVDGFAHSGIATTGSTSDDNEVRFNRVYSWDDSMDQFMTVNGAGNKFHHNYCFDCGSIALYRSVGNEICYNVIDGLSSNPYIAGGAIISLQPLVKGKNVTDNKIYNNIIYDRGDGGANPIGIMLFGQLAAAGVIERNEIVNNIFLNFDTTSVVFYALDWYDKVESNPNDPDVNIFRNNLAYGWTGRHVAYIEGTYYKYITRKEPSATYFNSYGAAYDNLDSDPGLKDPVHSEFWPKDANAAVVEAGYRLGASNDDLFDPGTKLTNSPLIVVTKDQPPRSWYIGAFALSIPNKMENPEPGMVSGFHVKPKDEENTN